MSNEYGFPTNPANPFLVVILVEAIRSNPNGDPDNSGAPREDYEGHGIISQGCIKRVIREHMARRGLPLYMQRGADLKAQQLKHKKKTNEESVAAVKAELADVRLFGGVLTQYGDSGRVCAAMQWQDARSILPVETVTMTVTRVAGYEDERKNALHAEDHDEEVDEHRKTANMGSRQLVEHAVYRSNARFDPHRARELGTTTNDLDGMWTDLIRGYDYTASSARPSVNLRRVFVFEWDASSSVRYATVERAVRINALVDEPSSFEEYQIQIDEQVLRANGVRIYKWSDEFAVVAEAAK